ncbi:MAG: outer membrane beta-barrel protein [Bacteroidales bacterium]|nr:outer membrane beta-barrel protein [Bacteroidales bacterium]
MQNSFKEDFDLQLKSMMEDAQEPAPAGAWRAISSRLDAIAGAPVAAAHRVWYWAGAALAAAAAIVLGVFFIGTSDNTPAPAMLADNTPAVIAEEAPVVAGADLVIAEDAVIAGSTGNPAKAPVIAAEEPVVAAEEPVIPGPTGNPAKAPVIAAEEPVIAGPTSNPAAAEPAVDPFAQMAYEDSRAARRPVNVSVLLTGGASGNNASNAPMALAAPGQYFQTGITETSQSSYGIPVIIGIGARLALTESISIGAGLDYSLLTRSFEGRYTDGVNTQTGDFNHTLQYLGIPVDLFVSLVQRKDIRFYSNVGAEIEKGISNKYRLLGTDTIVGDKVQGVQWSVGGGLGIEFSLGSRVALFAEPTFKYYFNCDQPKSIRTEKPFQMVLRAGLRFDLN